MLFQAKPAEEDSGWEALYVKILRLTRWDLHFSSDNLILNVWLRMEIRAIMKGRRAFFGQQKRSCQQWLRTWHQLTINRQCHKATDRLNILILHSHTAGAANSWVLEHPEAPLLGFMRRITVCDMVYHVDILDICLRLLTYVESAFELLNAFFGNGDHAQVHHRCSSHLWWGMSESLQPIPLNLDRCNQPKVYSHSIFGSKLLQSCYLYAVLKYKLKWCFNWPIRPKPLEKLKGFWDRNRPSCLSVHQIWLDVAGHDSPKPS